MAPFLKLTYLLAVVTGLFFLRDLAWLALAAGVQLGLCAMARIGWRPIARVFRKLAVLFLFVTISYSFFPATADVVAEHRVELFWGIEVHPAGTLLGIAMSLRVLALVLASTWVQRTGKPGEMAAALRRFGMPQNLAVSLDGTLALLAGPGEPRRGGGGRGDGSGKGGGTGRGGGHRGGGDGDVVTMDDVKLGRLARLQRRVDRELDRAEALLADQHPHLSGTAVRNLAVVIGISLAIMGLKMVQVLPGLPVAPGHKNVLMLPLFLMAAQRCRLGGLRVGITVGFVSFFLGYGKYGLFEIAHFVAPGVLADLLLPVLGRGGPALLIRFMLIGAILGVARFSANFLVIVLAGAPLATFAMYVPMLVSQVVFGTLSGFVSRAFLAPPPLRRDDAPPPAASEPPNVRSRQG